MYQENHTVLVIQVFRMALWSVSLAN